MNYAVGEAPAPKTNGKKPHPDRDEWVGYRWPATRITEVQRQRLCIMSNDTKQPMTQLLSDAVDLLYETYQKKASPPTPDTPPED